MTHFHPFPSHAANVCIAPPAIPSNGTVSILSSGYLYGRTCGVLGEDPYPVEGGDGCNSPRINLFSKEYMGGNINK